MSDPDGAHDGDYDEETAALMLSSSVAAESRDGLALIYTHYREPLLRYLRYVHGPMDEDDRERILTYVLIEAQQQARKASFDPEAPLWPLLRTIARRRAVDCYRAKARAPDAARYDESEDAESIARLSAHIVGTGAGDASICGPAAAQLAELLAEIRRATSSLPPQQRLVMEVQLAFPDRELDLDELVTLASNTAGELLTKAAVKRARQEARKKVAGVLRARGYRWEGA